MTKKNLNRILKHKEGRVMLQTNQEHQGPGVQYLEFTARHYVFTQDYHHI